MPCLQALIPIKFYAHKRGVSCAGDAQSQHIKRVSELTS